jgi:hypothetical protein
MPKALRRPVQLSTLGAQEGRPLQELVEAAIKAVRQQGTLEDAPVYGVRLVAHLTRVGDHRGLQALHGSATPQQRIGHQQCQPERLRNGASTTRFSTTDSRR